MRLSFLGSWLAAIVVAIALMGWPRPAGAQENDEEIVEFHGPDVHPGYPDAFHVGYVLEASALAPNKQFGVIYPARYLGLERGGVDFVVDAKSSQVLSTLDFEEPYFSGLNHGGLAVHWAPDSSAVLVENGGKWMPRDLVVVELKEGRVVRQTKILDALMNLFAPTLAKAEHAPVKKVGVGEMSIEEVTWQTGKGLQLQLKCDGGTNPKGFPDQSAWSGKLTAVWDVAQRKFVQGKVSNARFRKAGKEEE